MEQPMVQLMLGLQEVGRRRRNFILHHNKNDFFFVVFDCTLYS